MALSAVGTKKVCVTPQSLISEKAASGLKRPSKATISRPKYKVGSKASISPPVQAQSAGLQKTACEPAGNADGAAAALCASKPNQFWLQTKPVKLPISARCGISAPLGLPVVPLV